jgi:hypothetical protein
MLKLGCEVHFSTLLLVLFGLLCKKKTEISASNSEGKLGCVCIGWVVLLMQNSSKEAPKIKAEV